MRLHVWGPATLLGVAMLLLAGGNDKQAYLPLPPGEAGIAQPIPRNVTRHLEMTGQTVAATRDVPYIENSTTFRTNVGLMSDVAAVARVTLYDAAGQLSTALRSERATPGR